MMAIKKIIAREILDSRGNPTVEVDVWTNKTFARAKVPSGASTGVHEALELRDKGKRFNGKGVSKAVNNVNKRIAKRLIGMDAKKQKEIDDLMIKLDGTENKKKLGANAILGVSMAVCKAGALERGIPLYSYISELAKVKKITMPVPSFNVINGGKHAGNKLDIQEYMIMPVGARNFKEALRIGAEIYHILKKIIKEKYGLNAVNVGDEGGFAPPLNKIDDPILLLQKAIRDAGYVRKVRIAMDAAASEFYRNGKYHIEGKKLKGKNLNVVYKGLIEKYPIASIEDPFDQEDFDNFTKLTESAGKEVQIVGDDLLCTNVKRIQKAINKKCCNALLLKVNQIGNITEAIDAARLAQEKEWGVMVSHRSGETCDDFIADLAVGLNAGQIKSGAPCRSERLAKYNQLLRIEEELGTKSRYAGTRFRGP
ncbi:phosphopyruvate hydratase [Candidatus Woesearchaeota archaeon]|nr:phosphopyruvate hydratase [Candidatus Woesearchaeota archaeon]